MHTTRAPWEHNSAPRAKPAIQTPCWRSVVQLLLIWQLTWQQVFSLGGLDIALARLSCLPNIEQSNDWLPFVVTLTSMHVGCKRVSKQVYTHSSMSWRTINCSRCVRVHTHKYTHTCGMLPACHSCQLTVSCYSRVVCGCSADKAATDMQLQWLHK